MNRTQALTIGILAGFVVLAFMAMAVVILFPYEALFPAKPTLTRMPPTLTPSPTFPNFLPTESVITPSLEPTATNTRVPTATPRPPQTPTTPPDIQLPTPFIRPSATPTPVFIPPSPTPTPTTPVRTPIPRQYSISFEADETSLIKGECTDLEWEVMGAATIMLDGRTVSPSGEKEVCPEEDTTYQLTIQLPDSARLENRTVTISVEDE